jgi:hypothetical protein
MDTNTTTMSAAKQENNDTSIDLLGYPGLFHELEGAALAMLIASVGLRTVSHLFLLVPFNKIAERTVLFIPFSIFLQLKFKFGWPES